MTNVPESFSRPELLTLVYAVVDIVTCGADDISLDEIRTTLNDQIAIKRNAGVIS